jgi:Ca2+/Na+ antiporter
VLYDYQGMNQMGQVTVSGLVSSIKTAYVQFFRPLYGDLSGLSSTRWSRVLYLCNAVICLVVLGIEFIRKKGFWNKALQIILYIMLPLSVNIVYVMAMSDTTIVHTLMLMPYVFVILYGVIFLEKQNRIVWKRINYVVLTLFILYHMNLANISYLKANHQQEAAIAYYTEMISNIKGCEGYSSAYPVIFYGRIIDGLDLSISNYSEFNMVTLTGYNASDIAFIAYFCDDNFLKYHCGYTYQTPANRSEIIATEQFAQMPCYPEDGSIAVIDNVIVVKLSE